MLINAKLLYIDNFDSSRHMTSDFACKLKCSRSASDRSVAEISMHPDTTVFIAIW
jgi:hypothetical protein